MKHNIKAVVRRFGFDIVRYPPLKGDLSTRDLSDEEKGILSRVKSFTMTSEERIVSLLNAVRYISDNHLNGDIVECGVWRGGSMMAVALLLVKRRDHSRDLWLYDTYEGMTAPSESDVRFDGESAKSELEATPVGEGIWCSAGLADVRANLLSTGYPADKIHFVSGQVEKTIPHEGPSAISLLRLDTDWYESTRHELIHLYPLLQDKGVLFLDDYGHWQGARRAVDEFFVERGEAPYLHRVDYSGRVLVKRETLTDC